MGDPFRDAILDTPLYLKVLEELPAAPGISCATCMNRDNGVVLYKCEVGYYPFKELLTSRCLNHRPKPIPVWVAEARIRYGEDPLIGPFLQSAVDEYWTAFTGGDLVIRE